ncbi:MAG: glycosyltransferase [Coriobacteriia bacterium]|nr:glycosyltransferase [Coriobacteriia bacterium]
MSDVRAARSMRVLTLSPSITGGGAERVALSLHEAYLGRGVDSRIAAASLNGDAVNAVQVPRDAGRSAWARTLLSPAWRLEERSRSAGDPPSLASRVLRVAAEPRRWARVARGHEDFDFPWTARLLELPTTRPDVLHLHNLHGGYFDIRALPGLSARVPTIVTMHDTWLLTGHCAQPFACERWREGCGSCPDLGRYVPIRRDASEENRAVKRRALLASRVGLVAPSRWLLSMAEQSGLLGKGREGRVIPNGVDVNLFKPGDRGAARERLGLPPDRPIVLVVAKDVRSNPYKGFDTLIEALEMLPEGVSDGLLLVALGDDGPSRPVGRFEVLCVPFTDAAEDIAAYYQAADVFVQPSRAESFGMAPVEAMACGTPILVSDAGGLPEIVAAGESGSVFAAGDSSALAIRLHELLGDGDRRARYSSAGIERVAERFTIDGQVDAYLAWYAELMDVRAAEMNGVSTAG